MPIYGLIKCQRARPDDIIFDDQNRAILQKCTYDLIGLSGTPINLSINLNTAIRNYGSPFGEIYLLAFDEECNFTDAKSIAEEILKMLDEMDENIELQLREKARLQEAEYGGRKDTVHALTFSAAAHFQTGELIDRELALKLVAACLR